MSGPQFLETPQSRRLAYHRSEGIGPTVVFLGGLTSDMHGTKALYLESWARASGRAFLRFDYSGHGESTGAFEDGRVGDWAEDAAAMLDSATEGRLIMVGSSMGGWVSLLLSRAMPERVGGLVTIAAAADFTQRSVWSALSDPQKAEVMEAGRILLPSEYGEPLVITRQMIIDGRKQSVFDRPLHLPFPTRMLQGTADTSVDKSIALDLLEHATGPDIRLTLVKDADHRFSGPRELAMIVAAIESLSQETPQ